MEFLLFLYPSPWWIIVSGLRWRWLLFFSFPTLNSEWTYSDLIELILISCCGAKKRFLSTRATRAQKPKQEAESHYSRTAEPDDHDLWVHQYPVHIQVGYSLIHLYIVYVFIIWLPAEPQCKSNQYQQQVYISFLSLEQIDVIFNIITKRNWTNKMLKTGLFLTFSN